MAGTVRTCSAASARILLQICMSASGRLGTSCRPVVACGRAQGLVEEVGARAVLLDNSPGAANREGCTEALLDLASSAAADGASAAWLPLPAQAPSQEQQARPSAATLERRVVFAELARAVHLFVSWLRQSAINFQSPLQCNPKQVAFT